MMSTKVAIVTGASRGIGKATAIALGKSGCTVVVHCNVNLAAATEVCDLIKKGGAHAIPFQADCSKVDEVKSMFAFVKSNLGNVDVLVNNAGITQNKLAVKTTAAEFQNVVSVNLDSVFFCSQEAITEWLKGRRHGRIINMASVVGLIGNAGQSGYAASKAGIIGLTKTLAKEYGGRSITVNAVCPGFIESDMTKTLTTEKLLETIPLKRLGKPEEVAGLVTYLALDNSAAYITGHCFNIDGGVAIGSS